MRAVSASYYQARTHQVPLRRLSGLGDSSAQSSTSRIGPVEPRLIDIAGTFAPMFAAPCAAAPLTCLDGVAWTPGALAASAREGVGASHTVSCFHSALSTTQTQTQTQWPRSTRSCMKTRQRSSRALTNGTQLFFALKKTLGAPDLRRLSCSPTSLTLVARSPRKHRPVAPLQGSRRPLHAPLRGRATCEPRLRRAAGPRLQRRGPRLHRRARLARTHELLWAAFGHAVCHGRRKGAHT